MSVSCTVSDIFSVKQRRDLEIWVRGRSRTLAKGMTQTFGSGFLFAFYSNNGSITS